VQNVATFEALEENQNKWDMTASLMNQLLAGLRQSTRELNNAIKKRSALAKKQEVEEKKKRELAAVDKKKSEERAAKKRLVHAKEQLSINVDFRAHPEVTRIPNDAAFQAAVQTGSFFTLPWQLEASELLADVLTAAEGKTLPTTVARWCDQFQKAAVYVDEDVVGSPLLPLMGVDELKPLLEVLAPTEQRISNQLPSYQAVIGETKLLGESPTYVFRDFGVAFLGTMRLQVQGTSKVFMVPFDAFLNALIKMGRTSEGEAVPLANTWELLKGVCNAADLDELLKHQCKIYHCTVAPKQVLWVPAGWFHVVSTCNGEPVAAIRRNFALRGALKSMETIFAALKKTQVSKPSLEKVDTFLDILAVERGADSQPRQ
jgi:hypothetical protein